MKIIWCETDVMSQLLTIADLLIDYVRQIIKTIWLWWLGMNKLWVGFVFWICALFKSTTWLKCLLTVHSCCLFITETQNTVFFLSLYSAGYNFIIHNFTQIIESIISMIICIRIILKKHHHHFFPPPKRSPSLHLFWDFIGPRTTSVSLLRSWKGQEKMSVISVTSRHEVGVNHASGSK